MPKKSKTVRQQQIADKAKEEERKRLVDAALEAAADKLNSLKGENGGRVPYGAMPTALASLALLNINITPKKLIRLMEKRLDVPPVINLATEEASGISSLSGRGAEDKGTPETPKTNTRNMGRAKGSTNANKRKAGENCIHCIDSITRDYMAKKAKLKAGSRMPKGFLFKLIDGGKKNSG